MPPSKAAGSANDTVECTHFDDAEQTRGTTAIGCETLRTKVCPPITEHPP